MSGDDETPEDLFARHCRQFRLPAVKRQFFFALPRKWRFDFAFPTYRLAVEIDGVVVRRVAGELVMHGRHATVDGMRRDNEKINTAIRRGWSVLRFLQTDVKPRLAIDTTMRVLAARGWRPRV